MRVAFNYTPIRRREKKVYSLQDLKISSSGISMTMIVTTLTMFAIFNIIGIIICMIVGKILYIPVNDAGEVDPTFLLVMFAGPVAVAAALCNLKVQNYRLLEFILLYLKPKKTVDQHNQLVSHSSYQLKGIFEYVNLDVLKNDAEVR